MKPLHIKALGSALLCVLLLTLGCNKKTAAPRPVTVEQVPGTLENAFKESKPEISSNVNEVVSAVHTDDSKALLELQNLSARPDLTAEQRLAATRSMLALYEKLRAAAEKGDKKSAETLDQYRASK